MNNQDHLAALEADLPAYTPPVPEAVEDIGRIREAAKIYGAVVIEACPEGQERALAVTELENSVMWAERSIVLSPFALK